MNRTQIRLWLDAKYLEKEAIASAIKCANEDGLTENSAAKYFFNGNLEIDDFNKETGFLSISIPTDDETYIGSIEIKIDDDTLVSIIEYAVKKLNKIKSVMESVK